MVQNTKTDQTEKTEGSKSLASRLMSMSANFFSKKPLRAISVALVFLSMMAVPGLARAKQVFDIVNTAKDSVELVVAAEKALIGDEVKGTVEKDGATFDWSAPVNADAVKPALAEMDGLSDRFAVNAKRPAPKSRFMSADPAVEKMTFLSRVAPAKGNTHQA